MYEYGLISLLVKENVLAALRFLRLFPLVLLRAFKVMQVPLGYDLPPILTGELIPAESAPYRGLLPGHVYPLVHFLRLSTFSSKNLLFS